MRCPAHEGGQPGCYWVALSTRVQVSPGVQEREGLPRCKLIAVEAADRQVTQGKGQAGLRELPGRAGGRRGYHWLQVFTGDPLEPERRRRAVAFESMPCASPKRVIRTPHLAVQATSH